MTLDTQLRHEIATRIRAAVPEVMDILLFGSQARGDAREDSDIDLVLIVPAPPDRRGVGLRARRALWGIDIGIDLLVLTPEDWERMPETTGWYGRQIRKDAVRLDAAA